jgi:hypothetical protein
VETLMAWNGPDMDVASVISVYTEHVRSRNHGLDMLPLLLHLDRALVERRIGPDHGISARPTYHFRLPECRLDEPGWTLASEWAKWQLVEAVAADRATLDRIRTDRLLSGDPVAAARTHLDKYLSQEGFACLARS